VGGDVDDGQAADLPAFDQLGQGAENDRTVDAAGRDQELGIGRRSGGLSRFFARVFGCCHKLVLIIRLSVGYLSAYGRFLYAKTDACLAVLEKEIRLIYACRP
jgi:hypothetical protein